MSCGLLFDIHTGAIYHAYRYLTIQKYSEANDDQNSILRLERHSVG